MPGGSWLDTELDGWWDDLPEGSFPNGYTSTTTWLFMPQTVNGMTTVNPCSAWADTTPWDTDLRPLRVKSPLADAATAYVDRPGGDEPLSGVNGRKQAWLIGGSAGVAALAGAARYVLVRRTRRP